MKTTIMNKLLFFFVTLLIVSCQKEEKDLVAPNGSEALKELDAYNFIKITPDTDSIIELYPEFTIITDSMYVRTQIKGYSGETKWENVLVKAKVTNVEIISSDNTTIPTTMTFYNDLLQVKPSQAFNVNSSFTFKVSFTYYAPRTIYIHGVKREMEFSYNTTSSKALIPSMIYCEYPLERQYNFLQGEFEFGFIKTYVKPQFLLSEQTKVKITNIHTNNSEEKQLLYDEDFGILKYEMPSLVNNQIYKIEYLFGNNEELFRSNYFKTSNFNTFSEKVSDDFQGEHEGILWWIEHCFAYSTFVIHTSQGEPLDFYEQILPPQVASNLEYNKYDFPKLLTVEIDTLKTDMHKYGYQIARQLGLTVNRSTNYIGFIPIKDFFFIFNSNKNKNSHFDILLTDNEIIDKSIIQRDISIFAIRSYIGGTIMHDINGFKHQAVNSTAIPQLKDSILKINSCGFDRYRKYYYTMKYVIPGIDKVCFIGNYEIGTNN